MAEHGWGGQNLAGFVRTTFNEYVVNPLIVYISLYERHNISHRELCRDVSDSSRLFACGVNCCG